MRDRFRGVFRLASLVGTCIVLYYLGMFLVFGQFTSDGLPFQVAVLVTICAWMLGSIVGTSFKRYWKRKDAECDRIRDDSST